MLKTKRILSVFLIFIFLLTTVFGPVFPASTVKASTANLLRNPSFEEVGGSQGRDALYWNMGDSENGWTSQAEAITGSRYAWTQPGKGIWQDITIPETGLYRLSANARARGNFAVLGLRKADGTVIKSVNVPGKDTMVGKREEVRDIFLVKDENIQAFYGYGDSWCHVEDVELIKQNLITDAAFEGDLTKWNIVSGSNTVGIRTVTHGAIEVKAVYVDTNDEVSQTISVPVTGTYDLSAWISAENDGGSFGIKKADGDTVKNISKAENNDFQKYVLEDIALKANDQIKVFLASVNGKVTADSFELTYKAPAVDGNPPTATNLSVSGNVRKGQTVSGGYLYTSEDGYREGNSKFKWFISDAEAGDYTELAGKTGKLLELGNEYTGKYIKFEVIPADVFGKEGTPVKSTAVGPVAESILKNSGFESGKLDWSYDGTFTYNDGSNGIAYIDPGPDNYLSQIVTVPTTGCYELMVRFNSVQKEGAEFGIRFPGGSTIQSAAAPENASSAVSKIGNILLEKGSQVEVYVTGINANDQYIEIDDVCLALDGADITPVPVLKNIVSLSGENQLGIPVIDYADKKVTFKVPYGTDKKALNPKITVSEGASITPASGEVRDFTNPVTYTVKGSDNSEQNWTVECKTADREITIDSSNQMIKDAFNWAKPKAKSYVRTGKTGLINRDETFSKGPEIKSYMPSYWAGYAHRYAFYSRDMVHQMAGAHLLGLDNENFSMLKAFAGTANESSKWYPAWAINFDGSIFKLDYNDENSFVREVPAVFELVEKSYKMYMWTGDKKYINDEVMWKYYTEAVTDFIAMHDGTLPNGVAEGTGNGIFDGSCTYNERGSETPIEAGDAIASQYQAILSYAELQKARGDNAGSVATLKRAQDLKDYFNHTWAEKSGTKEYARVHNASGMKYTGFGKENSWFMPMKLITEAGAKNDAYLDFIAKSVEGGLEAAAAGGTAPSNIEAYTYLPDTFFPYNRNEDAWKWMKYIIGQRDITHEVSSQGTNGDYPEISYTLIGQTVEGLMGVQPDAPNDKVSTISHLPGEIGWLELNHIPLGSHDLYVRHDGVTKTTVKNNEGTAAITWEAGFYGNYKTIKVNGKDQNASHKLINGLQVSYAAVPVAAGEMAAAEVTPIAAGGMTVRGEGGKSAISTEGGTLKLTARIVPENATNTAVNWSVRNAADGTATDIAEIDSSGLLTAKKNGKVEITAAAADGSGVSAKVTVTITNQVEKVYLSDLNWTTATVGYGNGPLKDTAYDGEYRISLGGVEYDKGISTHAQSTIIYNLDGKYDSFLAAAGPEDERLGNTSTSVSFEIYGDGIKIYDSERVTQGQVKNINISVKDIKELKLVVTDAGDGINSDSAVWANAYLVPVQKGQNPPEDGQNPSGNNGNSTGSNTDSSYKIDVAPDGSVKLIPQATLEGTTLKAEIGTDVIQKAFEQSKPDSKNIKKVVIELREDKTAKAFEVQLPADSLNSGDNKRQLSVETSIGSVTVPGNMFSNGEFAADKTVALVISSTDKTLLSKEILKKTGTRPVIDLSIKADGKVKEWKNQEISIAAAIAYTPAPEELKNPDHIVVYHIDGKGKMTLIPNAKYDTVSKKVSFTTTQSGRYAVGYEKKTFKDIKKSKAGKQIEVLVSKGIIEESSSGYFYPKADLTRAGLIEMLIRTLGLSAKVESNFSDVKPGDKSYEAIGIAKKLGLVNGENKKFSGDKKISRQDMMVIVARALQVSGKLNASKDMSYLNRFKDTPQIAPYAKESIAMLVKEGIITGDGKSLRPSANVTKEEMAVVLYRIYKLSK